MMNESTTPDPAAPAAHAVRTNAAMIAGLSEQRRQGLLAEEAHREPSVSPGMRRNSWFVITKNELSEDAHQGARRHKSVSKY
jgi:hypothetical protein